MTFEKGLWFTYWCCTWVRLVVLTVYYGYVRYHWRKRGGGYMRTLYTIFATLQILNYFTLKCLKKLMYNFSPLTPRLLLANIDPFLICTELILF